ncbi:hypothetical protein SDC9_112305 [bioreactor metagenome]|uniref:Uncharacterized protein n=1 Tax=bioreactor metagenome TaxID=1076179 RepID=A0A645BIX1_9ZZZZ
MAVLRQHRLRDHQFAHQVDELIHLAHRHADRGRLHMGGAAHAVFEAAGVRRHLARRARYGRGPGFARQFRRQARCATEQAEEFVLDQVGRRSTCTRTRIGLGICCGWVLHRLKLDAELLRRHMKCQQVTQFIVG